MSQQPDLEALRKQVDALKHDLMASDIRRAQLQHEIRSVMSEFGYALVSFDREQHPIHGTNLIHIFGPMYTNERLSERFAPECGPYFDDLWKLVDAIQAAPARLGDQGWRRHTGADHAALDFTAWCAYPPEAWARVSGSAHVPAVDPTLKEYFLGTTRPLIPPRADCRIEYTAWNADDPCELSVVLGTQLVLFDDARPGMWQDPSTHSYCFAFGAHGNHHTVLQRCLRPHQANEQVRIEAGKKHRICAERIGGILKLTVDGRVAFQVMDLAPIEDAAGSYITLYSSTPGAHFEDLTVSFRDSCLTPDEWRLISQYRHYTLKYTHAGAERYFDSRVQQVAAPHNRPQIYLFMKEITDTVVEHLTAEKHKKAEEALRESNLVLEQKIADRTAELKVALEKLRASEQRYALAGLGSNDGLWDWNLANNEVYFSPRWKQMLGYGEREIENTLKAWYDLVVPEDLPALRRTLENHFAGGTDKFSHEYRMRHKSGEPRWVLTRGAAIRDANGAPLRIAGSQTDITTRKTNELALERDAMHDSLTGLPNRAHFRLKVAEAIHKRDTAETPFALLFLDLDGFKPVNDRFGHEVGDQLLIAIARRLEKLLRPNDVIARLGGDEFTVLLNNTGGSPAINRIAERMLSSFDEPFDLAGGPITLGVSIGVALGRKQFKTPDEIIKKADSAMYHVKMAKKK